MYFCKIFIKLEKEIFIENYQLKKLTSQRKNFQIHSNNIAQGNR